MDGVGLLWFDNTKDKQLINKIHAAIDHYITKYQAERPNLIMANPGDIPADFPEIDGVIVKADSRIIKNHLFVGVTNGQKTTI